MFPKGKLFQGGEKVNRHVQFAGDILGQDLLPSQLCLGEFPQVAHPLDLEDPVPVPLSSQQVIVECERIICELPVHPRDIPLVNIVQTVIRVERGALDEYILVIKVCEEVLVYSDKVVLVQHDIEIETLGDVSFVLVHSCIPEEKRVGKVHARTDDDPEHENDDLVPSIFIHRTRAPGAYHVLYFVAFPPAFPGIFHHTVKLYHPCKTLIFSLKYFHLSRKSRPLYPRWHLFDVIK